ncbi:MAG: hypothetical protein ACREP9_01880, partial [Candidatus Dormibacteraceae bacterium]
MKPVQECRPFTGLNPTSDKIARYSWYLRPPFDKSFERLHWWGREKAEPVASLYELARRHPIIPEILRTDTWAAVWPRARSNKHLSPPFVLEWVIGRIAAAINEPQSLTCLRLFGLRSWEKLSEAERGCWRQAAHGMKAIDSQPDSE